MSRVWIIVLVVLIIGGGIFLMSRNKKASQSKTDYSGVMEVPQGLEESANQEQTAEVTFTDGVFSPQSLTVTVGTKVLFLNYGSELMWVASDPHPDHTDLPGLNQSKAGGNGALYEYTFSKVGTWGYHNHMNPNSTGTVIVEE